MDYQPITKIKEQYKPHKTSTSITLLIVLYLLQGIPLGFFGNLPVLWLTNASSSKNSLPYLTLISYPFCFKLFLAPLQDMYYSAGFGRRKTYIVPCYYLMGFICLLTSSKLQQCVDKSSPGIITLIGIILAVLNAIADIGIDGWVLTLLDKENVGWGSSCQNAGQTIGIALGGPVFIALNSLTFCNTYIYQTPHSVPILSINTFFIIYGVIVLVITFLIHFFAREKIEQKKISNDNSKSLSVVLKTFKGFYVNKNIKFLMGLLITWRFGFAMMLAPAPYILLQKGFPKELLSSLSIIMIPLDLLISYLIGRFVKPGKEFKVFFIQFLMRIFDGAFVLLITCNFSMESLGFWLPIILTSETLCRVYSTASFVNFGAFFNRIADERVGGTYITALNSCHNLGNQLSISVSIFIYTYLLDYKIMTILGMAYELLYLFCFYKKIMGLQSTTKEEWRIVQVNKNI